MKTTKLYLKELASKIRNQKNKRPLDKREGCSLISIEHSIYELKYHFRHHHIAYCELRGRERHQIETPHQNNKANQTYIDKIKKEIETRNEKVICYCE